MKTFKELKKEGYYLQEEKYNNGVNYFSLQKNDGNKEIIVGEVSCKSAKKMNNNWGFEIKHTDKITCPLNFTPISPKENHFRYWVNEPVIISKYIKD